MLNYFADFEDIEDYNKYTKENVEIKRNALPPYASMKSGVIADCERRLPPMMVTILKAAIAAEKAEVLDELKYNNPVSDKGSQTGEKGRN